MWAWQPSWSCDQECLNKLLFPHSTETPYKNLASIIPVVSEEMFKECGRQTDNGRTTEAYLSYKLTNKPSAQVS